MIHPRVGGSWELTVKNPRRHARVTLAAAEAHKAKYLQALENQDYNTLVGYGGFTVTSQTTHARAIMVLHFGDSSIGAAAFDLLSTHFAFGTGHRFAIKGTNSDAEVNYLTLYSEVVRAAYANGIR